MHPYLLKSGVELAAMIKRGETTSEEVVRRHIGRLREVNPLLNAVVRVRVRDAMREFAADAIRPIARDCDEAAEIPADFLETAWSLGLTSTQIPEAYGGAGEARSMVTNAILLEELAFGDASLAMAAVAPSLFANALLDRYPVTNRQYEAFVRATGHRPPLYWLNGHLAEELYDHPVVGVDYFDATADPSRPELVANLDTFGSAQAVARAGLADLEAVSGISRVVARRIYDHFHGGP